MRKTGSDYDLIILGGGSAGIVSGVMAGGLGLRLLLIEKERMGGECLNTGCVPSKALIHCARTARILRTAGHAGLREVPITRDDAAGVMRYVRESVDRVREADATEQMLRDYGVEIRLGSARFLDSHTIALGDETLRADHFLLATGSHPAVPAIPGLEETGYRTNQTLFDMDSVPASLLVVGGGPVGVEMAQAFQLLGSRVTLVQRADRILPRDDRELTTLLADRLRADGVGLYLGATVEEVRTDSTGGVAQIRTGGGMAEVEFDEVLVATGRAPNTAGLDLEAAGVTVESQGIPVNARLQTSAAHIYACGDVLGKYQFSHMAEYEAKTAVRNIVFPGAQKASFRVRPWTTFTNPELAHAGMTEDEARDRGLRYEVLRQSFGQDDRAVVDDEGWGLVKVLTEGIGGRILGAQILGPRAGELIQEWVLAMEQGLSIRAIADSVHVYPTLTMASQHAAQRWYALRAQDPVLAQGLKAYVNLVRPNQRAIALGMLAAAAVGGAALLGRKNRGGEGVKG